MAKFAQLCAGERKVRRIGRTDRQMVRAGEEQGEQEEQEEEKEWEVQEKVQEEEPDQEQDCAPVGERGQQKF